MLSLLPGKGQPVHAETLMALCLADGVLEVLEWAGEGTGADPAASMWLAALRWYRLVAGDFPEGAPRPQPRPTDFALGRIIASGGIETVPGSPAESLAGLASGEMSLLPKSRQPGGAASAADNSSSPTKHQRLPSSALIRVLPIGLTPYVELGMKQDWAAQAVFLTHQDAGLVAAAGGLATELHRHPECPTEITVADLNSGGMSYPVGTNSHEAAGSTAAAGPESADARTANTRAGSGAAAQRNELLAVVVEDLARRWRIATR